MPMYIPNETDQKAAYIATEQTPGVAVKPTQRLRGVWTSSDAGRALTRKTVATGGYDRFTTIEREASDPQGSYEEDLSFESFPLMLRYGVAGLDGGVSDSAATPGYTYTLRPDFDADTVDTFTVDSGVPGLAWEDTGVRWNEWTISGDATGTDKSWKFSGSPLITKHTRMPGDFTGIANTVTASTVAMTSAAWTANQWTGAWVYLDYGSHIGPVRRIASNTENTLTLEAPALTTDDISAANGQAFYIAGMLPLVADEIAHESIPMEGTVLYLDRWEAGKSVIGTTNVSERVASFNVTQSIELTPKYRLPGRIARAGRGARWITGTIQFEYDRWDEYREWEEDDFVSIRIEREGSVIDATTKSRKLARIDITKAAWDTPSEDSVDSNMTLSMSFVAALPLTDDPIAEFTAKNALAMLP